MASSKKAASKPKKATAAPPRVTVELTTALSLESAPGIVRWVEGKPVVAAKIVVKGTSITAKTDARGRAQLAIIAPVTGRVLEIEAAPAQVSSGPAGPSHGAGGKSAPAFQFRPFTVTVDTDAKGFVADSAKVSLTAVAGSPPHALLLSLTADKLSIDWKPDFLKSVNRKTPAKKTNKFLVVHRTGGNDIRNSLNTFLNPADGVCIHYIVDVDGHVIKLAHETDVVNHTGRAFWQGQTNINDTSIGIELVHGGSGTFPDAQYDTLLRLVREIRAASPNIGRQQVVGHMEIATGKKNRTLSSRRIDDPGETFEWERLEAARLVRARVISVPTATVFGIGPGQFAQKGRLSPKTLQPDITAIQTALSSIGYSVAAANGTTISGIFDDALVATVKAFQRRYFSGGNAANKGARFSLGRIDFETAFAIETVEQDSLP